MSYRCCNKCGTFNIDDSHVCPPNHGGDVTFTQLNADLNKAKSLLSEMLRLNTYVYCGETAAYIALQKSAEEFVGITYEYHSGEPRPLKGSCGKEPS